MGPKKAVSSSRVRRCFHPDETSFPAEFDVFSGQVRPFFTTESDAPVPTGSDTHPLQGEKSDAIECRPRTRLEISKAETVWHNFRQSRPSY
jgi:hypothetical protein